MIGLVSIPGQIDSLSLFFFFVGNRRMSLKTPPRIILFSSPFLSLYLFHSAVWANPIQNLLFSFIMSSIQNIIWSPFWVETYEVRLITNWKETWTLVSIEIKNKIIFSQKKIDPLKQHILLPNPKKKRPAREVCLMQSIWHLRHSHKRLFLYRSNDREEHLEFKQFSLKA